MSLDAQARLRSASWLRKAGPFFAALKGEEKRTRAVGGMVRDTLLGLERQNADIDLATEFLPETVMAMARTAGLAAHPTGIEHGTVTLVHEGVVAEVTTLRKDVETYGRHARVVFGTDWVADAQRRDFTMNALYANADGELFDPLGGVTDCLAHRVRFIGDADTRIAEDRLRVYRYFRFCATHGHEQFEAVAIAACQRAVGTLDALSAERVGAEMVKLLGAPRCAATLAIMVENGILSHYTPKSALSALAALEADGSGIDAVQRMAVLVACGWPASAMQGRWRLSNAMTNTVEALVKAAELAASDKVNALAYRFPEHKRSALCVAAALYGWPSERLENMRASIDQLRPGRFPLNGGDLIGAGIPKGPRLGKALAALEEIWIDSGYALDRQALLARLPSVSQS